MTDNQFNKAQEWFEDLRNQLLNIVTEISEAKEFYKAEEYHQKYIQKTGLHCAI